MTGGDWQGSDPGVVDPPNWSAMSGEALHAAATNDNEPEAARALAEAWAGNANTVAAVSSLLGSALNRVAEGWAGPAAAEARNAIRPLAEWGAKAHAFADGMARAAADAASAAAEVKELPPPADFDLAASVQRLVADPTASVDLAAPHAAAEAVRAEQLARLDRYTAALAAIDARMPTFEPPPTPDAPVADASVTAFFSFVGTLPAGDAGQENVWQPPPSTPSHASADGPVTGGGEPA